MIVSIHQPAYLPWLGYFHKIAVSDIFLILDTTQFEKGSFANRNKINGPNGPFWLTVPLKRGTPHKENVLSNVQIDNRSNWQRKHWSSIQGSYQKSPFWVTYSPILAPFYSSASWRSLSDLCGEMLKALLGSLGIHTRILSTSSLPAFQSRKSDLILEICEHLGAKIYVSGTQGKGYLDELSFKERDIVIYYQEYNHPEYSNIHEFQKYLSVVDLLFNCGPESLRVLLQDNVDRDSLTQVRKNNVESRQIG